MRLLIAEDDAVVRRTLTFILEDAEYDVIECSNGSSALEYLEKTPAPVIAILDVIMPGIDGIELCRTIRSSSVAIAPYVLLVTVKGSKEDVIRGFDAGADDYITKPFDPNELLARVRVGARIIELQNKLASRVRELEEKISRVRQLQGLLQNDIHVYEFGPFRLEASERRLTRMGVPIPLTAKIFNLLLLLVQNSEHLIEKTEIMREVWADSFVEDNNLTVAISGLRRALGEEHGHNQYIETIPKLGYRFIGAVKKTTN